MSRFLFCVVLLYPFQFLLAAAAPPFSILTRTDLANPGSVDVVSADFNGDGIADIASLGATEIRIYLGVGHNHFRFGSAIPLPGSASGYNHLVLADFNQDGKPDLAAFGGTGIVFLNNGDGTFTQSATLANTVSPAAAADFNGDGKPDLAVGLLIGDSYSIAIFLGNGDGTFAPPTTIPGSSPSCITAADVNNDGKADIVSCYLVYLGNGNGTFSAGIPFTTPGPVDFLALADLNQDGKTDIVAIKQYVNGENENIGPVYVLYGNGNGTFQPAVQVHSDVGTLLPAAAIGDVNGDGLPDIVVLGSGGLVGVLINKGSQGFERAEAVPVTYQYSLPWGAVALANLAGGQHLDIIATGNASPWFSVLFQGHDTYKNVQTLPLSGVGQSITAYNAIPVAQADFNGDGLPDLAFLAEQNRVISITTMLRTDSPSDPFTPGPLTPITIPSGAIGPNGLVTGDFNNDGKPDIAICYSVPNGGSFSGIVEVYLGNGDGTFTQAPGQLDIPDVAFQMVTADFNGDGKADLAFSSGYVALGNGDGTFAAPIEFFPGNGDQYAVWIGVADFNHDGHPDIAFQVCQGCEFTPTLLIFLGNGDGTFKPPATYNWNGLAQWGAIADINNDGNPDIVQVSAIEGPNQSIAAVFLGNGDGTFKPPSYVRDAWAGQPNQIIAADLNGDGRIDLAITDWWLNTVYLFPGNGDGTFGSQVELGGGLGPGWISSANLQGQTTPGFPDLFSVDFLPNGFYPVSNETGSAISILYNNGWR
ncbi:MAG: VCBS repeat-containing protein [Bryobacteraceae bacterium]